MSSSFARRHHEPLRRAAHDMLGFMPPRLLALVLIILASGAAAQRPKKGKIRKWDAFEGGLRLVAKEGKLPVPNFAAGGIATPAAASLMMQLGAEAVFVGSGIFKSEDPAVRAAAIVRATTDYASPGAVLEASAGLGEAMAGIEIGTLSEGELLQKRGW